MKIVINESQYYRIISEAKYTDDDIRQEASKYNTQNEFMKGSPKIFYSAENRRMLDDLFPNRKTHSKIKKYSDNDIRQDALKYSSSGEFHKNSPNLYTLAFKRGLIDDLFPDRKKNNQYSNDDIKQEASKYKSQNEFMKGSPTMFYLSANRKMLDNLYPDRRKYGQFSDDDIRQEASKYNTQNEFMKGSFKMFRTAANRKMLDDLFPDRKRGRGRTSTYSDDDIRQEALKYNTQNEFKKGSSKMFHTAANRKMLGNLFPDRNRGVFSDDDIRQEASKYNSEIGFRKGNHQMFYSAVKRKMLDDLFPDRIKRQNENKKTLKSVIIENLKKQRLINRILDKISNQGMGSLDKYEKDTLDNENNPNFDEKSFLISKLKYIVEKYGNIFLDGLTDYDLPIYQQNSDELHSVNELTDNFVNIIAYGGPNGKTELAEYPVNYDELELGTLKSIDEIINDYEYGE
jgi:uncharacterized protein YdcH (DUF465 family)